jgi:hypothetical protein
MISDFQLNLNLLHKNAIGSQNMYEAKTLNVIHEIFY